MKETIKVCADCNLAFVAYSDRVGDRCPRCVDIRQKRPSRVSTREKIAEWIVKIDSLPPVAWENFQATKNDDPVFRLDLRGREFGKAWHGRIVIYAQEKFATGDVCRLRLMEARHEVRAAYVLKSTLHHGTVSIRETIPVYKTEMGEIETETREYFVLEAAENAQPQAKLVYCQAFSKTTLKGLGRQWIETIVFDPEPFFQKKVRGGVRSGRLWTDGILAVVPMDGKVNIVHKDIS